MSAGEDVFTVRADSKITWIRHVFQSFQPHVTESFSVIRFILAGGHNEIWTVSMTKKK